MVEMGTILLRIYQLGHGEAASWVDVQGQQSRLAARCDR
jgi:hypothetical protein